MFSNKMSSTRDARVLLICLLTFIQTLSAFYSEEVERDLAILIKNSVYIPNAKIQALKPKGFRASIPDLPHLEVFWFIANVNRELTYPPDDINEILYEAKDGRWTAEDPNLELKVRDVVNYKLNLVFRDPRFQLIRSNLNYTITALESEDRSSTGTKPECQPTVTTVRGGAVACAGQIIFEDNFDSLKDNVWQIEQYLPFYTPNFPFVSYQRLDTNPTVSVVEGNLRISPTLQQNLPGFTADSIYSGSVNLFSGCTASAEACMKQVWGADILPPIVSGRITSKGFAFTYGTVTVRAKLPQGDWIYPEILLEPFLQKYGSPHYSSGVIKIASARGNKELTRGTTDYSNKVLFGGPILDLKCHNTLLNNKVSSDMWGDQFHNYSVRWAPERIVLSVDGEEWARIEPTASGLRGRFPVQCAELPRTLLGLGSNMAPFDDHFYITLGVGAGSITEFPDRITTANGRPKPWSNASRKALLNFWQDMGSWLATWNQPQMLVDYVRVVAL